MAKPIVAIVGKPNVGKSTLFNRIIQEKKSIVNDEPGVTRDRIYATASWLTREFILIDTGGIEISNAPFNEEIRLQAQVAIEEADVIIFLTDVTQMMSKQEHIIARMLQKENKQVIIACNKVDNDSLKDQIWEYMALGFGEPILVSSVHGIGTGNLLDAVISKLDFSEDNTPNEEVTFSIIGRPNVGKSSLLNAILGEERVIVSDIAGTTRDAIDVYFERNDKKYKIIDTAGIRRKSKISDDVEMYSLFRAMKSVNASDISILVIDATAGVTEQDKKIASVIQESYNGCVIVINKWDLIVKDTKSMDEYKSYVREQLKFLDFAPIVFTSALKNKRIETLFPMVDLVHENLNKQISTKVLNDIFDEATMLKQPPTFKGGKLNIYYSTQVSSNPPSFVLFVNDPKFLQFSYKRYLRNKLREYVDFEGVNFKLTFRERK